MFTVVVTDPDGDVVAVAAAGVPAGATFDANARTFSWTPGLAQAGDYSVTIAAADLSLTDVETVPIHVADVNRPPVLELIGDRFAGETDTIAFSLAAVDLDGDAVAFSAEGLPDGAAFSAVSGDFTWTTDYSDAGTYTVTFFAGDGRDSVSETIEILIAELDRAPLVTVIGDRAITEGETVALRVEAFDPDGDPLVRSVDWLPHGATFDGTAGAFAWTPAAGQAGDYRLRIAACAPQACAGETIRLTVAVGPGGIPAPFLPERTTVAGFDVTGCACRVAPQTSSASPFLLALALVAAGRAACRSRSRRRRSGGKRA